MAEFQKDARFVTQEVTLDVKTGMEAKSYGEMAEAAELKPVGIESKCLKDQTDAMVQEFIDVKKPEEGIRNTNDEKKTSAGPPPEVAAGLHETPVEYRGEIYFPLVGQGKRLPVFKNITSKRPTKNKLVFQDPVTRESVVF